MNPKELSHDEGGICSLRMHALQMNIFLSLFFSISLFFFLLINGARKSKFITPNSREREPMNENNHSKQRENWDTTASYCFPEISFLPLSKEANPHTACLFLSYWKLIVFFFFINSKCLSPPFHVGGSSFSLNDHGERAAGSAKNRLSACGLAGVEFPASIEPFIFHWSLLLQLHKRLDFRVISDQVLT